MPSDRMERGVHRLHWLHAVAVLWLASATVMGVRLATLRTLDTLGQAACPSPACDVYRHPYIWVAVAVWIAGLLGAFLLWRAGDQKAAGRPLLLWP